MTSAQERFVSLFEGKPAILAPMEDVSDAVFRKLCRDRGADLCVTEFVNSEGLLRGCRNARRKITLDPEDSPTAIQIYGSDADRLAEAARVAEEAQPVFIDINCGCWVPKIAKRGAGAGWLREPAAMVAMAKMVVESVKLPVTVKTRIGYGPESHMPILDLAKRLEDVGVQALTIHCRTAQMGHSGSAEWSWAKKARDGVTMPVVVNGDIDSGEAAKNALELTGCAGVMIGRKAIEHPWIFREVRSVLDHGVTLAPPTREERLALAREHLKAAVEYRGERSGVTTTRRYYGGYLKGLYGASATKMSLFGKTTLAECLAVLDEYEAMLIERERTFAA